VWSFIQNLYESIKNEPFKIPEDDGNDLTHTFFNPDREGWLLKLGKSLPQLGLQQSLGGKAMCTQGWGVGKRAGHSSPPPYHSGAVDKQSPQNRLLDTDSALTNIVLMYLGTV
jgi:hypothetical protein